MIAYKNTMSALSCFLVCLMIFQIAAPPLHAQQSSAQESSAPFHITVLEGDQAVNNVHEPVNRGAMVVVEDDNKNPLPGVSVTFFLPSEGPSGVFPNGSRVLTVFTDDKGMAASRGIRFNSLVGAMKIAVTASIFSQTATTDITQTNINAGSGQRTAYVPPAGSAKLSGGGGGHHFPVKKVLILGVLAGAGVAAYLILTKSSKPAAAISVGTATITGPQ